ncbi:MAG: hypothetical protein JST22_20885 [Bacteroidetes bacterium]|nr:hypothetical protein [Bacteroidota bacterium]
MSKPADTAAWDTIRPVRCRESVIARIREGIERGINVCMEDARVPATINRARRGS